MSINLPHWLAEVVNILGFNWPEIDEDQLREAAKELRKYAHHCEESHNTTHGIVTRDLQEVYAAQSYTALVQVWGGQTQKHMQELIEACRLLADGLDTAALGVEGMKDACIVQLGIAAAELIGDQAAAVVTLGLSEAAAVAEIEVQNKILDGILQRFEQEVIGELTGRLIGPLKERIDHAVSKLVLTEAVGAVAGKEPGLKLDTETMRGHANRMKEQGRANLEGGRAFGRAVSALTFTTGG
ncbi:WXG100-like domain-containing protein [Streptomyces sp. 900105755]|uniref:WXG100-like domain-containing protein n=1 Tax=Streptomyces sp. 900105755 TaxID=3154389 RepID=UPI0033333B0A